MSQKILNISMNSCANWNLFGPNSSNRSAPYFIPYRFHEQTAPSWSAGQLKSSKSAKKAKINRRTLITPWVLDRFGWFLISNVALDVPDNSSCTPILIQELVPRAVVSWNPSISKKTENWQKNLNTSMSSWPIWIIFQLERSAWCALQYIPYNRRNPKKNWWYR